MTHGATLPRHLILGAITAWLAATPAMAETMLRLGETATVMTAPDELAATVKAEAVTPSAADSQNRVNAVIRDALAAARRNAAITASTGAYTVWRTGDRAEKWQATQTLTLSSKDGAALLTLVGELQQKGLVVSNLYWRLSRDTYRKARQEATRQAIGAVRGRVDEAAALLDLKFDHFKEVRLDSADAMPMPRPAPMAAPAMARAAAVEPTAVAEDQPVGATVQVDAVLTPR